MGKSEKGIQLACRATLTYSQIVIGDQSRCELAIEEIVRCIDGPYAGVGVVVRVHAETEGVIVPQGRCAPMIPVMLEAIHTR